MPPNVICMNNVPCASPYHKNLPPISLVASSSCFAIFSQLASFWLRISLVQRSWFWNRFFACFFKYNSTESQPTMLKAQKTCQLRSHTLLPLKNTCLRKLYTYNSCMGGGDKADSSCCWLEKIHMNRTTLQGKMRALQNSKMASCIILSAVMIWAEKLEIKRIGWRTSLPGFLTLGLLLSECRYVMVWRWQMTPRHVVFHT